MSDSDEKRPSAMAVEVSGHDAPTRNRVYGLEARVTPGVTFEEYRYWAKAQRAEEHEENQRYIEERGPMTFKKLIKDRFSHGIHHERKKKQEREAARQRDLQVTQSDSDNKEQNAGIAPPTEEEWKTASRALKTAGWGSVFYLITTDILGWEGSA